MKETLSPFTLWVLGLDPRLDLAPLLAECISMVQYHFLILSLCSLPLIFHFFAVNKLYLEVHQCPVINVVPVGLKRQKYGIMRCGLIGRGLALCVEDPELDPPPLQNLSAVMQASNSSSGGGNRNRGNGLSLAMKQCSPA